MNIKQVESDFKNGVLLSRATIERLIAYAGKCERALVRAGFVDHGAQEWKPPIGQPPRFIDTSDRIAACLDVDAVNIQMQGDFNADALGRVLADMAIERQTFDSTKRINANIDAQMAKAEEARLAKRDRRVHSVPVEFDRRTSADDRRSAVRRLDLRRSEDK